MAVFPLALFILSLSLLACAADLYKVLQGQTDSVASDPHVTQPDGSVTDSFKLCYGPGDSQSIQET